MSNPPRPERVLAGIAMLVVSLCAGGVWAQDAPNAQAAAQADADTPDQAKRHGFSIELGALSVLRSMTLRADANRIEHQPDPYVGGIVAARVELAEFDDLDAALRLDGEFGYGVARNTTVDEDLGREPVTQLSTGGARLGLVRRLGGEFSLFVGAGAHVTSFIVEANPTYTGHRYVTGEAVVELGWVGEGVPLAIEAELAALPVLALNQSSGGYGDGGGFGGRAQAGVGWNFLERDVASGYAGARLMLRYRYQRFRSVFPERRISLEGGASTDQQHAAFLTLGYFL